MSSLLRKLPLLALIMLLCISVFGKQWQSVGSNRPVVSNCNLISSDLTGTVINFNFEGYYTEKVNTPEGEALIFNADKMAQVLETGLPDLLIKSTSIIIPNRGTMNVEILGADYYDLENVLVAPSKGNILRTIDPNTVPYTYGEVYNKNSFWPASAVSLSDPFIIRDFRGVTVQFYPLAYNPVTKILRVYKSLKVIVTNNTSVSGQNEFIGSKSNENNVDFDFYQIYSSQFINFSKTRYTPVEEDGKMLVICYDDFYNDMLPFVAWKNEKGIETEMVKISEVGTTNTAIKNYIKEAYEIDGIKYVLLVGDIQQIPTITASTGSSDPSYGKIVGNDNYVDVFIGRFSAQNIKHVQNQVNKVLTYEKSPLMSKDWFSKGIGIASDEGQGIGHFGETDYVHVRQMREQLMSYNYTGMAELYDGSQGGEDAPGNVTAAMVTAKLNEGSSIVLYTGHGSETTFVTSGFSNNDARNLNNYGMWPFVWATACVNGKFSIDECFAEAWMRNDKDGQPIGSINYLGSSINQPWVPPMYGQDEMIDILTESYANNIKRTFGGISFNGVYKMLEVLGNGALSTADTWNCFGDPSVIIRTKMPEILTAEISSIYSVGINKITINCPVDGATVCLTVNGKILGKTTVVGGIAELSFDVITSPCEGKITISKYNYIPQQTEVSFKDIPGAFLVIDSYTINDDCTQCNNNNILEAGEEAKINLKIKNFGKSDCSNITLKLAAGEGGLSIINGDASIDKVISEGTVSIDGKFKIQAPKSGIDKYKFKPIITMKSGAETWEQELTIPFGISNLIVKNITLHNQFGLNEINPGEMAQVYITVENAGSVTAKNLDVTLTSNYGKLHSLKDQFHIDELAIGDNIKLEYTIAVNGDSDNLKYAPIILSYEGDNYINEDKTNEIFIGKKDALVINLEKKSTSADEIKKTIESIGLICDAATEINSEIYKYRALFICLGIYNTNTKLNAEQGDMLSDYLKKGGRIYMEGGDTWCLDPATSVHELFGIKKDKDGSSDLSTINGIESTFASGISLDYLGDNKYIDRIEPISPAIAILENANPKYITGIANKTEIYATIGVSHNFGGLVEGSGENSRQKLMEKYLNHFDLLYGEACKSPSEVAVKQVLPKEFDYSWTAPENETGLRSVSGNLLGYDIFLYGEKVGHTDANVTTFKVVLESEKNQNDLPVGVAAIYENCTSILSVGEISGVGVEDLQKDNIIVYPNPSNGKINIKGDYKGLRIYDLTGREVFSSDNNSGVENLSGLKTGNYILKVFTHEGDSVKKLIIQK